MIYAEHILKSTELNFKLPMVLELDNHGAVHLANKGSVGGQTRHRDV